MDNLDYDMWFGLVRFGSVRFGSVRFGSVRFGSVRFGWIVVIVFSIAFGGLAKINLKLNALLGLLGIPFVILSAG